MHPFAVGCSVIGAVFAIGCSVVFLVGLPVIRWLWLAGIFVGMGVAVLLHIWRKKHPRMTRDQWLAAALPRSRRAHECGHAIVNMFFGGIVEHIRISHDTKGISEVRYKPTAITSRRSCRENPEIYATCVLAGAVAEARFWRKAHASYQTAREQLGVSIGADVINLMRLFCDDIPDELPKTVDHLRLLVEVNPSLYHVLWNAAVLIALGPQKYALATLTEHASSLKKQDVELLFNAAQEAKNILAKRRSVLKRLERELELSDEVSGERVAKIWNSGGVAHG